MLSLVVYAGYKFVPPAFSYYMLKTDVEAEVNLAHMYTDQKLEERILKKASVWSVPVTRENLQIKRGLRDITVTVQYTERVTLFNRYTKVFNFTIEVNRPLKETSRILQ